MTEHSTIDFSVELTMIIDVVSAFLLGFLLFLIRVPNSGYSRKLSKTKNTIAACFGISAVLFFTCLRYHNIEHYEIFSSMMTLVVVSMSSVVLSFSLINLLDESFIESDKFYFNIALVACLSIIYMRSFWMPAGVLRKAIHFVYILAFIIQCLSHISAFRKRYRNGKKKLEQYYDEDEDSKLQWIHFCYVIMMLTQMFILVYRQFPTGLMKVYNVWYALFMLYFTANFISFLGNHKLTLDAFAYKTLTSNPEIVQRIKGRYNKVFNKKGKPVTTVKEKADDLTNAEFQKLEYALERWVRQKKFSEYDKSREDVARELGTSRELLHWYFTTRKGVDFKTWRTELRIEEAKKLLLENRELSTNVIGEIAGFSDRSNFYRQFVKFVGCSPKQWRESDGKI